MADTPPAQEQPPLTSLTKVQRRILGVLIEKGFTTPEAYPLTIKALTSGCNQKSNRHPMTNYEELDLEEPLNELRELGLVAVVHTETGRTERFRHWMRRRLTMTEPQLAILAELLLRGRQAVGELRARASRMAPIDSLEQLRDELAGLMQMKLVQADGPLDRRGVEVDHALYEPREQQGMSARPAFSEAPRSEPQRPESAHTAPVPVAPRPSMETRPAGSPSPATAASVGGNSSDLVERLNAVEATCAELRGVNQELRQDLESVKGELERLDGAFEKLRRDLGG